MQTAQQEIPFDLTKTEILNDGYVDLHVGRPVKITPLPAQQEGVEKLEAL